jgi:hypothetical protein
MSLLMINDSRALWRVNSSSERPIEVEHNSSVFLCRISINHLDGCVFRLRPARRLKVVIYCGLGMLILHPDLCL